MAEEHRFRLDTWAAWCEDTAETLERLAVELRRLKAEQEAEEDALAHGVPPIQGRPYIPDTR